MINLIFCSVFLIPLIVTLFIPNLSALLPKFSQDPRLWLLLIFMSYFMTVKKSAFSKRIERLNSKINSKTVLTVTLLLFVHFFIRRMMSYYQISLSGADFSHFDYAVWNGANGFGLDVSIGEQNHYYLDLLGNHFSPILYLMTFPFWFFDSHNTLQFFQALTGAASFWVMYIFGTFVFRNEKNSQLLSALMALSLVFSKYFLKIISFEFHHEFLYAPLSLLLLLNFQKLKEAKAKLLPFIITTILVLSVKEDSGIIIFGFGLYALFFKETRLLGIVYSILGPVYLLGIMKLVMPLFFKPEFDKSSSSFVGMWSKYGSNLNELIKNIFLKPHWIIQDLVTNKAFIYLVIISLGSVFLSFSLFTFLPMLTVHAMSKGVIKDLLIYYSSPMIGLWFGVICLGLMNSKINQLLREKLVLIVFVLSLAVGIGNYRLGRAHQDFDEIFSSSNKAFSIFAEKGRIYVGGNLLALIPYSRNIKRIFSDRFYIENEYDYILMSKTVNSFPLTDEKRLEIINLLRSNHKIAYEDKHSVLFQKL